MEWEYDKDSGFLVLLTENSILGPGHPYKAYPNHLLEHVCGHLKKRKFLKKSNS